MISFKKNPRASLSANAGVVINWQLPNYYIFFTISSPNSLVFNNVAPSIWRSKS